MPASLPGSTAAANATGNPSAGPLVIMDPLSGPDGSPYDKDSTGNASTGALSTGIGFGGNVIGAGQIQPLWNDNDIPGEVPTYAAPPPAGVVASSAINSTRMYIGGGRMVANNTAGDKLQRPFLPSPYTAGVAIGAAGAGLTRDNGAGPAFLSSPLKLVTAAAGVAIGAVVETGFTNRSGVALTTGQSVFGTAAALAAPSFAAVKVEAEEGKEPEPNTVDNKPIELSEDDGLATRFGVPNDTPKPKEPPPPEDDDDEPGEHDERESHQYRTKSKPHTNRK